LFVVKHKNGKMKMMKKIFLFGLLFLLLAASQAQAALVPCGGESQPACTLCHLFVMLNNIIKFVMFNIIPAIAVIMLLVSGVMFFFGGAKPGVLIGAKGIITSVVIGLLIIFCAWVIVNTILTQIGLVESSSLLKWYDIQCSI